MKLVRAIHEFPLHGARGLQLTLNPDFCYNAATIQRTRLRGVGYTALIEKDGPEAGSPHSSCN
jgi:hypothetical protein